IPFSNPLPAASKITKMKIPHKTPKAVSTVLNQLLLNASMISVQLSLLNSLFIKKGIYGFNIGGSISRKKTGSGTGNNQDNNGGDSHRKIYGGVADIIRFNEWA